MTTTRSLPALTENEYTTTIGAYAVQIAPQGDGYRARVYCDKRMAFTCRGRTWREAFEAARAWCTASGRRE